MPKHKLSDLWRATRKPLFVVLVAIIFYELLEHFPAVQGVWSTVKTVLRPIIWGLFLAFIVNLPMRFLEDRLFKGLKKKRPKLTRGLTALISYVIVLGIIALIIGLIVPKMVGSVAQLVVNVDVYYASLTDWFTDFWEGLKLSDAATEQVLEVTTALLTKLKSAIITLLPKVLTFTISLVTIVYSVLVTLVISVYAVTRKEKLLNQAKRFTIAVLPEKTSAYVLKSCTFANKTFRKYFAGQFTSCFIIGVLCYICMRIFSMPFPELISVFICVAAMVPIVGPWISTVPSAFIILMASPQNPLLAVWFVVMILVIQEIDNNFIYPKVVGDAVGISGIWVLGSVIVGGGLFGFTGILIAVPTMAVIYRLVGDWVNTRVDADGSPAKAMPPRSGDGGQSDGDQSDGGAASNAEGANASQEDAACEKQA